MIEWISHVPAPHVSDLRRRLQSRDDDQLASAFWELYLHEAYLRMRRLPFACIGEGDEVRKRLYEHARPEDQGGKDFWAAQLC